MSDTFTVKPSRGITMTPYASGVRTYIMTPKNVNDFVEALYGGSIIGDLVKGLFKDPLGGVMSLVGYPIDINRVIASRSVGSVKIGNVDVPGIACKLASVAVSSMLVCTFNLTEYGKTYKDYAPYMDITLYLPFIGAVPLDVASVVGRTVKVYYSVDLLTGSCTAYIATALANEGGGDGEEAVIQSIDGTLGINIPFGGVNARESNANLALTSLSSVAGVAGVVGGAVSGNAAALGAGTVSLANTAAQMLGASRQHAMQGGAASPSASLLGPNVPYMILDRIKPFEDVGYAAVYGRPNGHSAILGDLRGYAQIDRVHLSGFTCTADELAEIETKLKGGVIF